MQEVAPKPIVHGSNPLLFYHGTTPSYWMGFLLHLKLKWPATIETVYIFTEGKLWLWHQSKWRNGVNYTTYYAAVAAGGKIQWLVSWLLVTGVWIWSQTWGNVPSDSCTRSKLKSGYASTQSEQCLRYLHDGNWHHLLPKMHPVKIQIRLRKCAVWSESSLGAHVRRYLFGHCG